MSKLCLTVSSLFSASLMDPAILVVDLHLVEGELGLQELGRCGKVRKNTHKCSTVKCAPREQWMSRQEYMYSSEVADTLYA